MTGALLVVGSVNVDFVSTVDRFPRPGETILGSSLRVGLGGKGANQAVAAALDGAWVQLIAATGADAHGEMVRGELARWGVDVTGLQVVADAPTGTAHILVDAAAENMIVVHSGANETMEPDLVDSCAKIVQGVDAVLTQGELPAAVLDRLAQVCVAQGIRFVLNLAPPRTVDAATLAVADPLVLNEHEARSLGLEAESVEGWHAVLGQAVPLMAKSIVVTLGAAGAVAASRDAAAFFTPAPAVRAVDATGAGDAFSGVLAAQLATGRGLVDAVQDAVEAASYAVCSMGTVESYRRRNGVTG